MRTLTITLVLLTCLAAFLCATPSARAGEEGLLQRLNAETTRLVERARRATVRLSAGDVTSEAVLVGSPPRLVTTFAPIGPHEEVLFTFHDGAAGRAKRIAGERELDIVVYELPAAFADRDGALAVETSWALPPGRVAVLGGKQPRLLLTRSTRGPRDGVLLDDPEARGALLDAYGHLLAFRPAEYPTTAYYWVSGASTTTVGPSPRTTWDLKLKPIIVDWGRPLEFHVTPTNSNLRFAVPPSTPASVLTPKTFLPAALIHRVLDDLRVHGHVRHAYLGVVPAAAAGGVGARLVTVLPDSPAAKAELREGDVVTWIGTERVTSVESFTRQLVLRQPGEGVTLRVEGREGPVRVTLGAQEEARGELPSPNALGFEVVSLTPELRTWLGVEDAGRGVAVRHVTPLSAAGKAGLKRGDVILKGGEQPTRDVEELHAALAGARGRITLTLRRPGRKGARMISLPLPGTKPGAGPR